jgi:hypothetical protein
MLALIAAILSLHVSPCPLSVPTSPGSHVIAIAAEDWSAGIYPVGRRFVLLPSTC